MCFYFCACVLFYRTSMFHYNRKVSCAPFSAGNVIPDFMIIMLVIFIVVTLDAPQLVLRYTTFIFVLL